MWVKSFVKELTIKLQYSPLFEHDSNEVVERLNQTIVIKTCTILQDFAKSLWNKQLLRLCSFTISYLTSVNMANLDRRYYTASPSCRPLISTFFFSIAFIHISNEAKPCGSKMILHAIERVLIRFTKYSKIFHIYLPAKYSNVK